MVNIVMSYTRLLCDHDILHKGLHNGSCMHVFLTLKQESQPPPPRGY